MEEETEYKKLPVEERCVHKMWKARVDGYEEATKLFRTIDDEKAPEWNKFLGLIKKFITDSNVVAQEKGLEATLVFVENCGSAGRTVGEAMTAIVTKAIGAPKTKTKDLAVQITLMYIEIEKHENVIEELIKGFDQKNPKIVIACVSALLQALREFGSKVINLKALVKKIPALLQDRDKGVRDEAKMLTVEIFRWIGPVFKTQIASLPAVVLTELETEFDKVKSDKAIPTRYLRSQQAKQVQQAAAIGAGDQEDGDDDEQEAVEELDPMDLIDPVDILSKLPKDFYEKLEAKKWQDRKEALEALEVLAQSPKLAPGDYGDVIKALKKVITKDSNVVLVALAGKILTLIAKGLGKKFSPYAVVCISAIFEKFKEKKLNVVTALRDALDAIYPSTNLEAIQEDVVLALANKNPNVKAETASFLARSLTKTQPAILVKKLLKLYVIALLKTLSESDPIVRDASADALGTAMKLVGEKAIAPYLTEVDALKMEKIKEYFEKAVITVKVAGVKKERPQSAPLKAAPTKGGSTEPKPVSRPASAAVGKKPVGKKSAASSNSALAKSASTAKVLPTERDLSQEEVDERVLEILPVDVVNGLGDANWKTRLSSMETFMSLLGDLDSKGGVSQILIRTIAKKPGLKDTNFQVLKLKLDAINVISEKLAVSVTSTDYIMNEVVEKLGDPKNSVSAAQVLTAIAEAIRLEYVVSKVLSFAFEQKSPKVQQEALLWVNSAIKEFGFQLNPKMMIDDAKKAVLSTNPVVRGAGITLLGTMFLYVGNTLMMFFENEKPALKQQIQTEFDKYAGQKPPVPTRGDLTSSKNSTPSNDDEEDISDDQPAINLTDLLPRVDISSQVTEALLAEMMDKNWKTRNEALIKFQTILQENKLIKQNLGDLPQVLTQRLVDSNAKIAQTTVEIVQQIAVAMGPPCRMHVRALFPGVLRGLGDSKSYIRTACITCINTWGDQCGYKEFFDGEMIADGLKAGTPALKSEVWSWLSEKLPDIPTKSITKDELTACLPHLYANICDRNADVRKNANEAVLGFMIHLGYDAMLKAVERQKPASKKDIQAALDKARPNLPVKPLPKSKQQAPVMEEKSKLVKPGSAKVVKPVGIPKPGSATAASRKKEEDVDLSPLFCVNNIKHQRLLDEQKLKVLKWTFTTPREEFTDLLKEQMNTANLNKSMMANMFHDDFRYHLKVIDSLTDDLPSNPNGLICNLDLVLKWLSLRFYDTNPSVLLRGLDYLNFVFQMLVENSYVLTDNEGSSFIPHLLTKIGDPKDAVRNGVRNLLRQICLVFPFSKVFVYLMDALKSKNARQRTECLDELGYLIETYNLTVCQPTPQHALKEIARHISDRDNSVRNAALNTIVKAWDLTGDKIYKLIGQLSEKDLSMLDERIKRFKRTPKPLPVENIRAQQQQEMTPEDEEEEEEVTEEEVAPVQQRYEPPPQVVHRGPFGLDPDIIAEIERGWVKSDQVKEQSLPPLDLSFMDAPIQIISNSSTAYPMDRLNQLLHSSPTSRPSSANVTLYNSSTGSPQHNSVPINRPVATPPKLTETLHKLDPKLLHIIRGIASEDSYVAHASLIELGDILESAERQAVLRDYEEIYMNSIMMQFKHLSQKPLNNAVTVYQPLLHSIYLFFSSKSLGQTLTIPSIKSIISLLLGLMADGKLNMMEDNNQDYTKVINSICLKILDRCNFTYLNCALVRLLKETCSSSCLPKFTELLMKCIWRNVKLMPERVNELDYELVLLEIHEFMLQLPTSWWQQRPSDTPNRTIKTIIHNMTKIKGNAILQHLNNIPKHSELNSYVLRILKNLQKENDGGEPTPAQTQRAQKDRLSRNTHDQISSIFKLISEKETAQQGILKLHEFKTKNPDVDINLYLRGASPYFQQYIQEGLAGIQRMSQNNTNNNQQDQSPGDHHVNPPPAQRFNSTNSSTPGNPDYWMDKLNSLRVRANLPSNDGDPMDNRMTDENLNLNQVQSKILSRKEVQNEQMNANRLELLQQKLAHIKQQK